MNTRQMLKPAPAELEGYKLQFSRIEVSDTVIEILRNCPVKRHRDGFGLTVPEMAEPDYKIFKQIVQNLKGRWKRPVHLFAYNPAPLLAQVIEAGYVPHGNPFDLFETPDETTDDLFCLINLPEQQGYVEPIVLALLEPSAGSGRIARKLRERLPHSRVDVAEIDPFNRYLLQTQGFNLICRDWLKDPVADANKRYDYIVTNPPFNKGEYVKHIRRDFELLKPHGGIAAVVPDSMLTSSLRQIRSFRNWVAEFGYWESIGSVFEDTKTSCLIIEVCNLAASRLDELWQPVNGYASRFHESVQISLDCSEDWHLVQERAKKMPEQNVRSFLSYRLDAVVEALIQKKQECYLYDERVKRQLLDYAMRTYRDE